MEDNVQGDPIWAVPHLFWAWPHARIVFSGLVQLCSGKVSKLSHHIFGGVHPSGGLVGVFHIKEDNVPTLKSLMQQSTLPFHTPVVLQPNLSSVSSHHGCSVHYPLTSMGWCPSLHQTHVDLTAISSKKFIKMHSPCLLHITWNIHLSSVHAPVDVPGRSLSFPFIHSRVLFLAWCWVITRPLSSCGVVSVTSPRSRLDWGGSGTSILYLVTPAHMGTPASDAKRSSQLLCRMCECSCWSFTSYVRMSVTIWHTTSWGLSSHLSLIFFFPWKASALSRTRSPGFKPMAISVRWCGQSAFLSSPSFPIIHMIVWWDLSTKPFIWGLIGHDLQLLHCKEFAHLTNKVAHEVCTTVT